MAHTTLASTDRALEKIGDFVAVHDYISLKAVGRTFAQKAGIVVGFRRSIPKRYAKKGKRRLPAVNSHAKALGSLAEPYLLRALREDSSHRDDAEPPPVPVPEPPTLPHPWQAFWDASSERYYFGHPTTGQVQWDMPVAAPRP